MLLLLHIKGSQCNTHKTVAVIDGELLSVLLVASVSTCQISNETYMTQFYTDVLANCPCLPSHTASTVESNFYLNLGFVLLHNSVLAKFNTI